MSDLQSRFEAASARIKTRSSRPSNDDLLALYSLFKQATEGDVKGSAPSRFKVVERAKWKAWEALKGTGQDQARERYIATVDRLMQ